MTLNMLENAMDSLCEAIEYYRNGVKYTDERCFKYCIMLLAQSAELCLKEVLSREHDILIYENIDDSKSKEDRITLNFKMALNRVKNICNINLGAYATYIENLAQYRNKIQHYKCEVSFENCQSLLISSFSAIEHIVTNILNHNFDEFDSIISNDDIEYLRSDQLARSQRKKDISREIKDSDLKRVAYEYRVGKYIYIPCPHCSETYLVFQSGEEILCKLCSSKFDNLPDVFNHDFNCVITEKMKREIGRRKDEFSEIYECNNCNNDTLVYCENNDHDPNGEYSFGKWICLSCGKIISSIDCDDCGEPLPTEAKIFAQSYDNTDDCQVLCKECGNKLKKSEYGSYYEIN